METRIEKISVMYLSLHLSELPELERQYLGDFTIVSDKPLSIEDMNRKCLGKVDLDYASTPLRRFAKSLWKDKNKLSFQVTKALSNPDRRKKFLLDLIHGRKPDYTGFPPLSRLEKDGNVYFNIYGNPNDCDGIRDELLEAFTFPAFDSERNEDIAREIGGCDSVAIHARVVDFNYGIKDAVERGYFQKAVKYIKKRVPDCKFFIFSDNPAWCRDNLSILGLSEDDPHCFIDWNKGMDSFRDMQLISLCKHQIIPNSTFSWWGGYLNRNPDKIFITPYATFPGTISF